VWSCIPYIYIIRAYTQIRGPICPRVHVISYECNSILFFYIPAIKNYNNNNNTNNNNDNNSNNSKNGNKLKHYVHGFGTDGARVAVGNVAGFRGGH